MPEIFGPPAELVKPGERLAFVGLRAVVVYLVLLLLLRWAGKREMGQMTPIDLVLILLVANALQNAMVGEDNSITSGLLSALALFLLNAIAGRLTARSALLRRVLVGVPVLLVHDGAWIEDNCKREGLATDAILQAMREHGIARVEDVASATLETDGNISFIPKEVNGAAVRRTVARPANGDA